MFRINWDKNNNGVKLTSRSSDENLGTSPRPVFHEELDFLGLDKFWSYSHSEAPLLWACDRKYYYKGEFVMEVKGGNLYEAPEVFLTDPNKRIKLNPIDLDSLYDTNKEYMFLLESEAVQFINSTYIQYAKNGKKDLAKNLIDYVELADRQTKKFKEILAVVKQDCDSFDLLPVEKANDEGKPIYYATNIDVFLASYSGGKDSQVLLDLVTRAIPSDDFQVVYSDTGYELPPSLNTYEVTKEYYKNRFPKLKFYTALNHQNVLEYWDKIGTPSNIHRWCCSVMKTAPLYKLLKEKNNQDKQPQTLTFDGVRAEESDNRSRYKRIGKGVKHNGVINASPILNWNQTEIFIYLFTKKLPLNPSYRLGFTRAGCLICPFSSSWNDRLSSIHYSENLSPFLNKITNVVQKSGVKDIQDYIKNGNWKLRAGGREVDCNSNLEIVTTSPDLKAILIEPQEDFLKWLWVLGKYKSTEVDGNIVGEINIKNVVYKFKIINDEIKHTQTIFFEGIGNSISSASLLKRVLYKTTYCIHCEACEVECPTGALQINNEITINKSKCIHCHKCLNFCDKGCIVANSINITGGNMNSKTGKTSLNRYNNFGLREDWLSKYLTALDNFAESDHGLNPKEQVPPLYKWLNDAEICNLKDKKSTITGKLLGAKHLAKPSETWEIIWINLTRNSPIASWYCKKLPWGSEYTLDDIYELLAIDYPGHSKSTIKNAFYSLCNTFKYSPLGGNIGIGSQDKNIIKKQSYENVSNVAFAYSLYRFAEDKKRYILKISDFYQENVIDGIYREFGISKQRFEKILRTLNNDSNKILNADLSLGLEHITLREDLTSFNILQLFL